ncbi:MAG: hypothetical protein ACXABI_14190 [Candidatus Hodarchaeales archaeon]|jgi:ribosomal protein S26
MTDYCAYHPNKEAVAKCIICGKLICLADTHQVTHQQAYIAGHSTHRTSAGTTRSSPIVGKTVYQNVYCIPCNCDRVITEATALQNPSKILLILGIVLLPLIIGIAFLMQYFTRKSKAQAAIPLINQAKQMKEEFFQK